MSDAVWDSMMVAARERAATWVDPKEGAKRERRPQEIQVAQAGRSVPTYQNATERRSVTVSFNGYRKTYSNVLKAFTELGLPVTRHSGFRAKLRKEGERVFGWKGVEYHFKVV